MLLNTRADLNTDQEGDALISDVGDGKGVHLNA